MKRGLAVVGTGIAAGGLAIVANPGFAGGVTMAEVAVPLIGVVALMQATRMVIARANAEREQAETGEVERRTVSPAPGDDLDEIIAHLTVLRSAKADRQQIRERLQTAAITLIRQREHCSEAAARERIESGAWTDDPLAAAFLADEGVVQPPLSETVRNVVTGEPLIRERARRTVDELTRLAYMVDDRGDGGEYA